MEILTVKNLNFTYPLCSEPALHDISFQIHQGEFIVLCGKTGCGKSTLLKLLKPELSPLGQKSGEILFQNQSLETLSPETSAQSIGFVMQNPEQQIVTDKVWHELAYGLENLNTPKQIIARRSAEMASYFGISAWYQKPVSELSGGQKQLLNLASVMMMHPEILILDEPTAQLDPITASDFLTVLKKLNQDFGLTILLTEHRLEEAIPLCDKLLIMQNGKILNFSPPREAVPSLKDSPDLLPAMPSASRIFLSLPHSGICPLTVREGRNFIHENFSNQIPSLNLPDYQHSDIPALVCKNIFFRYEKHSPDILKNLNLTVFQNEIFCILGENGSGKSTLLKSVANLLKIYSGSIKIFNKNLSSYKNTLYQNCLALLPQDVQTLFLKNTVRKELEHCSLSVLPFSIEHLLDRHPYDLSGGEQQIIALIRVLSANPKLLLLDEPTKGIDASSKLLLIQTLQHLKQSGLTIIIITHDIEFASECADRCALLFQGEIIASAPPREFFSQNHFYTTSVSRMTRNYFQNAVSVQDAVSLCLSNS